MTLLLPIWCSSGRPWSTIGQTGGLEKRQSSYGDRLSESLCNGMQIGVGSDCPRRIRPTAAGQLDLFFAASHPMERGLYALGGLRFVAAARNRTR
jgi:hypothetical protein